MFNSELAELCLQQLFNKEEEDDKCKRHSEMLNEGLQTTDSFLHLFNSAPTDNNFIYRTFHSKNNEGNEMCLKRHRTSSLL